MDERWLPIVGYEGLYEVSDRGRVRRAGTERKRARLLKTFAQNGYLFVSLFREGHGHNISIHAAVMGAFTGPRPVGYHIHHGNGDRQDNHLTNLQYLSPTEHARHRVYTESWHDIRRPLGEEQHKARLTAEIVLSLRHRYWVGGETYSNLAREYGVCPSTIQRAVLGDSWGWLTAES